MGASLLLSSAIFLIYISVVVGGVRLCMWLWPCKARGPCHHQDKKILAVLIMVILIGNVIVQTIVRCDGAHGHSQTNFVGTGAEHTAGSALQATYKRFFPAFNWGKRLSCNPPGYAHEGAIGLRSFAALETTLFILLCLTSKGYMLLSPGDDIDNEIEAFSSETWNNSDPEGETGYLVYSPSCRIPDIPPFHESIRHLYKQQNEVSCSSKPMLTSVSRMEDRHVLHLHKKYFRWYSGESTTCYYRRVQRADEHYLNSSEADNTVRYRDWVQFYSAVTLNQDDEFIHVRCDVRRQGKVENVYTNMHAFVGLKTQVVRKMREADEKIQNELEKPLSVMILGIDSISRLNMIRTMPKTAEYLERNGWFTLKGYNKVDDNTFPNLMAMLTGMNTQQVRESCYSTPQTPLDSCPLLWKNFSQQGYITAYAEDIPRMGTFNFYNGGFMTPPTDYYLRPFMLAADEVTNHTRISGLTFCLGPVRAVDHILTYSLEFATIFRDYPTFSLFWLNGFSHNDVNTPTMMDEHVKEYFEWLEDTGALNNTVVIFLSDHGMRFGKIRETYVGYMEERLPFIYFWLPEGFKTTYPEKVDNLAKNANRLTSTFDVYLTLADVLGVLTAAEGCPECVSLFKEVPWNRGCMDAGITDHWCTCEQYVDVPKDSAPVLEMARTVADEINAILLNHTADLQVGWQCSSFQPEQDVFLRSRVFINPRDHMEFLVGVQTTPGNALFEATVVQKNSSFKVEGISRISPYNGEAKCMHDSEARKYCYCQNSASIETTCPSVYGNSLVPFDPTLSTVLFATAFGVIGSLLNKV